MRDQFMALLRSQVRRGIYVWGRVGEEVKSADWIRAYETSTTNADRAIALWEARKASGIDPIQAFDCSGLIVWVLRKLKLCDTRHTSRSFRALGEVTTNPQPGDFALHVDANDRAYHIGIVSGEWTVIEARGRDHGVVETTRRWHEYRTNPFLGGNMRRELKLASPYMIGEDVREFQVAANDIIDAKLVVDGEYGPKSEQAAKDLQTHLGLTVDGVVGDMTWGAIDDALEEDFSEILIAVLQTELAQAQNKIDEMETLLDVARDESERLRAERQRIADALNTLRDVI
jgi:peptidoglycan hydrolase-like protein with peptidoglycan-binding domain